MCERDLKFEKVNTFSLTPVPQEYNRKKYVTFQFVRFVVSVKNKPPTAHFGICCTRCIALRFYHNQNLGQIILRFLMNYLFLPLLLLHAGTLNTHVRRWSKKASRSWRRMGRSRSRILPRELSWRDGLGPCSSKRSTSFGNFASQQAYKNNKYVLLLKGVKSL